MKKCCGCTKFKELSEFHVNKKSPDGLYYICKKCVKPLGVLYREKNKARLKIWEDAYASAHPGLRAYKSRLYQTAKLQRTPKWLNYSQKQEIKEFYKIAKELQWLSDPTDPLTVDHIVPIQGENISGLHVPWNLQILPRSLNSSKGASHV